MAPTPIEQQQRTLATITDALTNNVTPAAVSSETMIADASGNSTYTTVTNYLLTVDSRITTLEKTFTCRACNKGPFSDAIRRNCTTCGCGLCQACAGNPPFCNKHRWQHRLYRFFIWLTTR